MFKRISIILFLLIFQTLHLIAQKELSVGDYAPQIKVFSWVKGDSVSKFRNGKIYVVEFGATWCVPCGKIIPHLTALANKWKNKVDVVGIFVREQNEEPLTTKSPRYVTLVKNYVQRQGADMKYTVAVDGPHKEMEKAWLSTSGSAIGIPRTFVIDKQGKIAWMGNFTQEKLEKIIATVDSTGYNIDKMIAAYSAEQAAQKTKFQYDDKKLLLIDQNGGADTNFLFRSILSKSTAEIPYASPPMFVSNNELDIPEYRARVQATAISLPELYMLAYADTTWSYISIRQGGDGPYTSPVGESRYGRYWHDPILEVSDPSPFKWTYRSHDNKYNYSLKIPLARNTAKNLQAAMQRDLMTYFGYDVTVEDRMMPYWKLIKTDSADRLLIAKKPGTGYTRGVTDEGGLFFFNAITRDIIRILGTFYGHGMTNHGLLPKEDIAPFIDETGITREFDFVLGVKYKSDFSAFLSDIHALGLDLVKSQKLMKVVVIRDPKP